MCAPEAIGRSDPRRADHGRRVPEEIFHLAFVPVGRMLVADRLREAEPARERLDRSGVGVLGAEPRLLVTRVVERAAVTQELQRLGR